MKYYKYRDEYSEIQGGYVYRETKNGVVFRNITVNVDDYIASNVHNPYSGQLEIPEGKLKYDDFDDIVAISESEFEDVWDSHLSKHLLKWQKN